MPRTTARGIWITERDGQIEFRRNGAMRPWVIMSKSDALGVVQAILSVTGHTIFSTRTGKS